jgi:hypothetical protein
LGEVKKTESELQAVETERADKSMFVQELILALLADSADQNRTDYKDLLVPLLAQTDGESHVQESATTASSVRKSDDNASAVGQPDHRQSSKNSALAAAENNSVHDHPVAAATVSLVGGRPNAYTMTSAPTVDSRTVSHSAASSVGPRAVAKRKSVSTANTSKAGKETSSLAANAAAKRH